MGLFASVTSLAFAEKTYDYWVLTKAGDFYALMSLFEDDRQEDSIFFEARVRRATESLMHCAGLYRALGVSPKAMIQFRVRYGGLRGRKLWRTSIPTISAVNTLEDRATSQIEFRLDQMEANITQLVKKLCADLFIPF